MAMVTGDVDDAVAMWNGVAWTAVFLALARFAAPDLKRPAALTASVRGASASLDVRVMPATAIAKLTLRPSKPSVRQGDVVDFTLVNRANIPHSMDFHAAEIAPSKYYVNVLPNDSLHYRFTARVPGAFMYHCGTAPAAMHIANGMYGAIIVDPSKPRPKADEFVFVQSEFYMSGKPGPDGTRSLEWERLLGQSPDHVVFNGRADQYASHPIHVRPNQLLRLYLVNAGPNRISSFHVVGGIFERVFEDGSQANPLVGVQTVDVPVGGGSIFEVRLRERQAVAPKEEVLVITGRGNQSVGQVSVVREAVRRVHDHLVGPGAPLRDERLERTGVRSHGVGLRDVDTAVGR